MNREEALKSVLKFRTSELSGMSLFFRGSKGQMQEDNIVSVLGFTLKVSLVLHYSIVYNQNGRIAFFDCAPLSHQSNGSGGILSKVPGKSCHKWMVLELG